MLDFFLQELNPCGGEVEQLEDSVVDLGLGVGQLPGESVYGGPPFAQVRLPLVGCAGIFERIGGKLEAGLERRAQIVDRMFPPGGGFFVQRTDWPRQARFAERR